MQRRTLHTRVATLASLLGAGGGSPDCQAPSTDDLWSMLPDGDAVQLHEDEMFLSENNTAETGGTKASLLAEVETGGQTHRASISRFPSDANATWEMSAFLGEDWGVAGSPVKDRTTLVGRGPYRHTWTTETSASSVPARRASRPVSSPRVRAWTRWS